MKRERTEKAKNIKSSNPAGQADIAVEALEQSRAEYHRISVEDAKKLMDSKEESVIVLDVREQDEYNAGHIEGATLLPSGIVKGIAESVLPDKNAKILVYCASGARSNYAARELVSLGYTQVYDFGGIFAWPYDVVKS